jgi:hypothetical protein
MHAYNGNMKPSSSSSGTEIEYFNNRSQENLKVPCFKDNTDPGEWIRAFKHEVTIAGCSAPKIAAAFASAMKGNQTRLLLLDPVIAAEVVKEDAVPAVLYNRILKLMTNVTYERFCKEELKQLKWDMTISITIFHLKLLSLLKEAGKDIANGAMVKKALLKALPIALRQAIEEQATLDDTNKIITWIKVYGNNIAPINAVAMPVPDPRVTLLEDELKQVQEELQKLRMGHPVNSVDGGKGKSFRGGRKGRSRGNYQSHRPTPLAPAQTPAVDPNALLTFMLMQGMQTQAPQMQQQQPQQTAKQKQGQPQQKQLKWGAPGTCTSCGDPSHNNKQCPVWLNKVLCAACGRPSHTTLMCYSIRGYPKK